MASEHLKYYISSVWDGKGAKQAKQDISGLGKTGASSSKKLDTFSTSTASIGKTAKNLATAGALGIVANQAFEFGKASVQAASDAEEAYGKFDVVFGEFAKSAESDLDAIGEATGRSKYELIDYASTIQDTFVPLGFARGEAAKMSTAITELAIDLASFNNLETADVVRDLQSALVGNTETLRKYGVVAQQTQINQEAITLGLWDGVGAIDAQTKAQAILSLTYKGTTDAQGDAIRTSDSLANSQRAQAAAVLDLQVQIGQGLAPAMATATKEATEFVKFFSVGITQSQLLEKALEDGIVTDGEYAASKVRLGVGLSIVDETLRKITKSNREMEQGMTDAEATALRYYQGMILLDDGLVAVTEETLEARKATFLFNDAMEAQRSKHIEAGAAGEGHRTVLEDITQALFDIENAPRKFGIDLTVAGVAELERAKRILESLKNFSGGQGQDDRPDPFSTRNDGAGDQNAGDEFDRGRDRPAAPTSPTGNGGGDSPFSVATPASNNITQNFYSNTRESQALAWAQAEQLRRARTDAM